MSITAVPLVSRLQMRLNHGLVDGEPVIRTRTYSNVKTAAVNDNVYAVAQKLSELQVHALENIRRVDEVELVDEE